MKIVRSLLLAALGAWLLACAAAWSMQEQLVFRPSLGSGKTPASRGLAYEDVALTASDGVRLHGWYLPPPADARAPRHILFLHGNAGNISHRLSTLEVLHGLGHAVLIVDYRGYGQSDGTPNVKGTLLDATAAWQWLVEERAVPPRHIVLYGRSLGGAVATALAQDHPPAGLVLESAFTSLTAMGAVRYPWLPVRWLLSADYNTLERIARVRCPVLIAHSPDDRVVPYAMGRELARRAPAGTTFVTLRGSHDRAFLRSAPAYHAQLDAFIHSLD